MTAETQRRVAGRYLLLEPIGRGGMGVVWRAHDELLDRLVAVKEVLYRAMSEEDRAAFNRRTIREARAAGRLDHPSVVVVHDVIEEDDRPWIVMQLVRSRSLGEVLRAGGPLEPRVVAEIGGQVLDALRAAHAAGVLHRDVKPENVLLTEGGRVVLTDFGIATMSEETALTTTGNLSGTPAFMPPERLKGRPAVPESDLWSLGATLYAAVEGRPPFDRGAPVPTMAAVLNDRPEPTRLAGPLGPVIEGLLRKEPVERMSAAEAAEALRRVAAGELTRAARGKPSRRPASADRPPVRSSTMPNAGQSAWSNAGQSAWSTVEGSAATVKGRGRSRVALLAGLPLLVVAIAAGGWFGYREVAGTAAVASHPPAGSASPTGASAFPTATSSAVVPPATPSTDPTGSPSATPSPALPKGWRTHVDDLGFTVALPRRWVEFGRDKTRVNFRLPGSRSYLLIDTTPWRAGDPLTALRDVEEQSLANKKLPGYELLTLRSLTYRDQAAADWEFTWEMEKERAHVIDRALATADGRQFAIYWHTTDQYWEDDYSYFETFTRTFRPS
ncbi:serine/threonine-protein kinase [Sphaerisporangium perillae]|uniref:serine/threonine-protein kinase n=1 Tax=Sphaerisporangium perillae TaxID=2935860 RepID=UPI00200C8750|nr:serine/threonine-protein kinase [Sphaerisporangium perillae]